MNGDVIFTGIKNGRPTFSFDGEVPPKWLQQIPSASFVVKDGGMFFRGVLLQPGDVVTEHS